MQNSDDAYHHLPPLCQVLSLIFPLHLRSVLLAETEELDGWMDGWMDGWTDER